MLRLLIVPFFVFTHASVFAQITQLNARVDKNPAMLDETIVLTVEAVGDADRNAFDSSVLLRDFVVGRTSVSSQTSIINGTVSKQTLWTTSLTARATGTFTLPAFTIDGVSSAPILLSVIEPSYQQSQGTQDYFVTSELSTTRAYVQQQVLYSVKLYMAEGIERGSIQAPVVANTDIQAIGQDRQFSEILNGRRYQVVERHFSIIPQQSGSLRIPGAVFTGEVLAPNTNLRFGMFNRTKQITRTGPELVLDVRPIPSLVDYAWLPSEKVVVEEEWSSQEWVVGEPITRTITLTALGVRPEQLPEITPLYPPQFRQYPDQSTTASAERDNRIIAQRVQSVALIPSQAGELVLPDVVVSWFDVTAEETRYARLPARTLSIKDNPAAPVPESKSLTQTNQQAASNPVQDINAVPATTAPSISVWTWAFALLWFGTLLLWIGQGLRQRRTASQRDSQHRVNKVDTEQQAWQRLQNALQQAEPAQALDALQQWFAIITGASHPVVRAADSPLTAPLQPLVDKLLASRYSAMHTEKDTATLTQQLVSVRQTYLQSQRSPSGLPALYP